VPAALDRETDGKGEVDIMNGSGVRMVATLALGIPLAAAAFAQADPKTYIRVEGVAVRPTGRELLVAEIRLRNLAGQVITAYGLTINVRYPGGKEMSLPLVTDSAWALALERIGAAPPPNTRFAPGTVVTDSASFPPVGQGEAMPSVRVSVEMVAFADRTVCGPLSGTDALQDGRRREGDRDGDIAETLRSVAGSPVPRDELTRIIVARRSALPSDRQAKLEGEARLRVVERAIAALIGAGSDLGQAQRLYEARRDVMLEHSTLRREER